jgi:hypothetical protein
MIARQKREAHNIAQNQGHFKEGDVLMSYGKMMRPKREATHMGRMSVYSGILSEYMYI